MTGDLFTVDQDALDVYLAVKFEEYAGVAATADNRPFTFQDFDTGDLHHVMDSFIVELLDQGVIKRPAGWTIAIYVLDVEGEWAYLPTVRSWDEHPWERRPFVQLTELTQEVRLHWEVAAEIVGLLDLLNRLLPAAEAALETMASR